MKTAVLTDSTAYIPKELRERWNIYMVPLNVIFENESYQEEVDLSTEDFYDMVKQADELPKTSQPSFGLITETLEKISRDYDAVIAIHLSSGISGTYQSVIAAGEMVEDLDVFAFDSEISCYAQGFYVLEAAEMADNGATPEQIMERLKEMKTSMRAYLVADDLTHLHRGGRLNGAQALVGSLLQVKPVLHFENGIIVPFEKIRTRKKALKRIMSLFDDIASAGEAMRASIIHAQCLADAEALKEEIEKKHKNVEVGISYFGPVIGTHLGEGAIGIGWYKI